MGRRPSSHVREVKNGSEKVAGEALSECLPVAPSKEHADVLISASSFPDLLGGIWESMGKKVIPGTLTPSLPQDSGINFSFPKDFSISHREFWEGQRGPSSGQQRAQLETDFECHSCDLK